MVDILRVSPAVATFFLEASQWNPHAAVQLHLQGRSDFSDGEPPEKVARIHAGSRADLGTGLPHWLIATVDSGGTVEAQDRESSMAQAGVLTSQRMDDGSSEDVSKPGEGENDGWQGSVMCDGCELAVRGVRYQCLTRVNFDLCDSCMWANEPDLRSGHRWLKMQHIFA
ncbi:MAG: hypothetical protein SGPRY_010321 [Prymnesium sp.]